MLKINENYEVMVGKVYAPTDLTNAAFLDADGLVNEGYTGTGAAPLQDAKYTTYGSKEEIPVGKIGVVDGVLYSKNADGTFTKLGTLDANGKLECEPQENGVDYKQGEVVFSPESYWNPPFDYNKEPFKDASIEDYYMNLNMGMSKRYDVPWIAMEDGKATTIKARFNDVQSDVVDADIVFACQTKDEMVILESTYDESKKEHTVTIYGGEAEKSLNVYAIYAGNGKCYTLGRARIQNMPSIEQTLVLVPVGRTKESVDKEGIETYLNQIYGKLGVKYNVTVDEEFGKEEDGDFSFMADGLAVTGTGFMTTETDDMKQLKKLYKQSREIKDDAAYIFILKKAKTDDGSEVAGDMPRSHQVGYVFSEDAKYSDAKTIAHELGHGLYSFEHTFENKGAKQGSTDNLMDYNDGVADKMLKVWQWNLLYTHKSYTVPFLEDDEDAMKKDDSTPIYFKVNDEIYKWDDKFNGETTGALLATTWFNDIADENIIISVYLKNENGSFNGSRIKGYTWAIGNQKKNVNLNEEINEEDDLLICNLEVLKKDLNGEKSNLLKFNCTVVNVDGKETKFKGILKIELYSPIFEFVLSNYDSNDITYDFFFDDGYKLPLEAFKQEARQNFLEYYPKYRKDNYSPWIGMLPNKEYELIILNKDSRTIEFAKYDRFLNLKIYLNDNEITNLRIKYEENGIVKTKELSDASIINEIADFNKTTFVLKSKSNICENTILMKLSDNDNDEFAIGRLNYIIEPQTKLTVSLVYLKQGNTTTSFPGIEDYLNKISMNRLFCSFEIKDGGVIEVPDNINLNEGISKDAFMNKLDDLYIQTFKENPWSCKRLGTGGSINSYWFDYFYVTNAKLIYNNERIEGAHREGGLRKPETCTKGGYVNSSSVRNEIASHEFGHWLGLIHTFDDNKYLIKHHSKYNNIGAYMDYCSEESEETQFPRERWFIYELREVLQSIKNLKSFIEN